MSNDQEPVRRVVVTDIRMPFWSMVAFMVKWAIAAIPALLLLVLLGAALAGLLSGVVSSVGRTAFTASSSPPVSPAATTSSPRVAPFPANVPDRCIGSYEIEKCVAQERKLAQETPEERERRQRSLAAERSANMAKIK